MSSKNKNRGGSREGAGRPSLGSARIKTSITLTKDHKEWLDGQSDSLSMSISKAIQLLIAKNDK